MNIIPLDKAPEFKHLHDLAAMRITSDGTKQIGSQLITGHHEFRLMHSYVFTQSAINANAMQMVGIVLHEQPMKALVPLTMSNEDIERIQSLLTQHFAPDAELDGTIWMAIGDEADVMPADRCFAMAPSIDLLKAFFKLPD